MSTFRFEEDPWIEDELDDLRQNNHQLYGRVENALAKFEKKPAWSIRNRDKNCKPHVKHLTKTDDGTNLWYVLSPPRGDNIFRTFLYLDRQGKRDIPKYIYAYQKKEQTIPEHRKETIVNRYWQRKGEEDSNG